MSVSSSMTLLTGTTARVAGFRVVEEAGWDGPNRSRVGGGRGGLALCGGEAGKGPAHDEEQCSSEHASRLPAIFDRSRRAGSILRAPYFLCYLANG